MVQRDPKTTAAETLARIQDLKARRDRTQEQLTKAGRKLFEAKEERDTILMALYGLDHSIELLEQGQLPMFGDEE